MIRNTSGQDVIKPRKQHNIKKLGSIAIITAFALALLVQQISSWNNTDMTVARSDLKIATVERGNFIRDLSTTGKIVAANAPVVYSPESGVISLSSKPGQTIAKGEVIATVESPELMNQLAQQVANYKSQEIALERFKLQARRTNLTLTQNTEQAKVAYEAAQRELNRAKQSLTSKVISQQSYERAQDKLESSKLAYTHAKQEAEITRDELSFESKTKEYELKALSLALENLKRRRDDLQLVSPVDGIIGNWLIKQKAKVEKNQSLLTVVDLSQFEAELEVPESYAKELELGLAVQLMVAGESISSEVVSVSPEIVNGAVKIRASIQSNTINQLRQNQRLSAKVIFEEKTNALVVKRGPIIKDTGKAYVYQVTNGIINKSEVQLGATSITHTEVLSGMDEGDQVVISSIDAFENFTNIRIR